MSDVSIIITTHNRPGLLLRAIKSAHSASHRGVEVVVVDDASQDNTSEVCRGLQNVKYVRLEHNQGVAGARNCGILASRGEYLSFLDDDDIRLEGSLDGQLDALESAPEAGFIYGQAILGLEDGRPTGDFYPAHCPNGDIFWELLTRNFVPCGAAVFRRSCLDRVGLLNPNICGIDDWDLWVRIAELYQVLSEPRPVMIWRKSTPVSAQGSSDALRLVRLSTHQFKESWSRLTRVREASGQRRRESYRSFSVNMTSHLLWDAVRSLLARQILLSQKNILAALRLYPLGVARVLLSRKNLCSLLAHAPKERAALKGKTGPVGQTIGSRL